MATGTAGTQARDLPWQALNHYRKRINYNDTGITSAVKQGTFPNGARLLGVLIYVKTAFNGSGTNILVVGTNSSSYNNCVASGDVDLTSASKGTMVWRGMDVNLTADTDWYAKYTDGNSDSTAGVVDIIPLFVSNN